MMQSLVSKTFSRAISGYKTLSLDIYIYVKEYKENMQRF